MGAGDVMREQRYNRWTKAPSRDYSILKGKEDYCSLRL